MKQLILLILCITTIGHAQDYQVDLEYYLPTNVNYNPQIPTPKSVIGHEVGDWHITHDKLAQYMYAVAAASDRMTIENRGTTFEGRPLLLLTVTAPVNIANIENIRTAHVALTNENSNSLDVSSMPIVVNQGFSIHGNEPSGANAALALAYYLAAAQGSEIDNLLQNTVILLDPCFNPDGLQRFAYWANMHKSQHINPDPQDREYDEVWPGGRTNHYWFDMNRDWLPVQLPESRARIETFHSWYPNILTDHHEMGTNASFFFQPGIPSRTHPLTPQQNQKLTGDIAKFHARAFDKIGSFYYTEESFDDFYYGKGSTFPDINGSIGILFEQASSRGHAQESANGILTFPFTIRNQFTAALSTLEAAVAMRTQILNYQRDFFNKARNEGSGAIVFGDEKDSNKAYRLAEILQRHKITFHELEKDVQLRGKNYKKGAAYVIPKNQKQSRLINAMVEKRTTFTDSLFYDISAWSFPLAFNLDYDENASLSIAGKEVTTLQKPVSSQPTTMSNYAYLMEWHDYQTPEALYQLLDKGIRAKVGMKQFSMGAQSFDYGTILIPVKNQEMSPSEIFEAVNTISKETGVTITTVSTGLTKGIDLGSNQFRALELPKIALLVGEGMNPYDAGEIWHLLDTRYNIPVTKLDVNQINRADLSRYTDIVMVNTGGKDKNTTEKLKTWVRNGGTLIAYKNAGKWLNSADILKMKFNTKTDTARNISYEQRGDFRGAQVIGGAIFETMLDRSHPISFGYKNNTLPVFRNSTLFLEKDKQSYNNPIRYSKTPLLSGYISDKNLNLLRETSAFKVGNYGRGNVIYFTDNHNFRAFWYGTNKLLMNAIYFGNAM